MFVLLCTAVLAIIISGNVCGQGQECLSGFPSPINVTTPYCLSCCTPEGSTSSRQLRIFPTMTIICNGTINGITVAGQFGRKGRPFPVLQIWRPGPDDSMTYTTTTPVVSFPLNDLCSSLSTDSILNVQRCYLVRSIFVEVGDIIGILLPRNHIKQAGFLIYFTGTDTPSYEASLSDTSFTLPSDSTQPDYDVQPLLYLDITPDLVPTESEVTIDTTTISSMNTESSTPEPLPTVQSAVTQIVTELVDTTIAIVPPPTTSVAESTSTHIDSTSEQSTTSTETNSDALPPNGTVSVNTITPHDVPLSTDSHITTGKGIGTHPTSFDSTTNTDSIVETKPAFTPKTNATKPTKLTLKTTTSAVGGVDSLTSFKLRVATAGACIGGVIALLLLVLIVVLVAVYLGWNRKRKAVNVNRTVVDQVDQLHYQSYNDVSRSNTLTSNSMSDTRIPVWENPSYEYPASVTLDSAHYDDTVVNKAAVIVNMGAYETQGDVANCMTPVQSYETPVDTLQKGMSLPVDGHYEWGLVVPSQEMRTNLVLSLNSQTSENVEGTHAAVRISQYGSGGPAPKFFEECETYWAPSSNANELYQQLSTKKYREILRPQIQLTEFLGAGAFGTVSKGLWQSPAGTMCVAIKTIQNKDEAEKVKFLQEAAIMGQFRHPNVVKLLGVVTIGEPVLIVLELLANGDLHGFLQKQRPAPGEMVPSGTPRLLLKFCQDISCGMEYLARKAFVHRDLAARNILVAEDKTCKISDFGMSRDLMADIYYVSHGGKVPVKWTAPEAVLYKKYSTASDVWSFGCVMYEIWSLGHKPFEGYTNIETIRMVDKGHRLSPPPGCPREFYKFMIDCWHPDRSRRPSFAQLVEMLSQADFELLYWRDEDSHGHPQALVVGAPLEAGENLYSNLQQAYLPSSNKQ